MLAYNFKNNYEFLPFDSNIYKKILKFLLQLLQINFY